MAFLESWLAHNVLHMSATESQSWSIACSCEVSAVVVDIRFEVNLTLLVESCDIYVELMVEAIFVSSDDMISTSWHRAVIHEVWSSRLVDNKIRNLTFGRLSAFLFPNASDRDSSRRLAI